MKRKKLTQILSVALLGATILTGANALPANSASSSALSNANNSSIEAVNLNDASIEIKDAEKAYDSKTESEKSETTDVKNSSSETTIVKDTYSASTEKSENLSTKNKSIKTGFHCPAPFETHYYDENGNECKGLTKIDGKMYFFKETSVGYIMAFNETIDGHYFNANGVCAELSDVTTPEETPSTENGWVKNSDGNSYYYKNGKMITSGFYTPGPGGTYYFYESGASAKGWTEIDGKLYYFEADGDGYVMACNTVVDGRFLDADGVCNDTATVKVNNADEAIKLIKENDSIYLSSLENELGSINLRDSGLAYSTVSYIYSDSELFEEPMYQILVLQNNSYRTLGSYLVGSVSGKVYSYKNNFKLVYEMQNNEIVSTVYRNPGPMGDYDSSAWR